MQVVHLFHDQLHLQLMASITDECQQTFPRKVLAVVHQPLTHNAALSILADRLGDLDVGLQEELAHSGVLAVRLEQEAEIWLGVDRRAFASQSSSSLKILVVMEPPDVKRLCTDDFDIVLTWHADHLRSLSSARLFVPATPWILPTEWPQFHGAKTLSLGFLRGSKKRTEGHKLRHLVWEARERLETGMEVPIDFVAGGGVSRDERNRQFASKFVLVIENSRHENYFTEKLLDALLCRCVPIYWGCSNIADFFDASGVVQIPNDCGIDEVIDTCQKLGGEDYECRLGAIDHNFELACHYTGDFGQRLQRRLADCLAGRTCEGNASVETVTNSEA